MTQALRLFTNPTTLAALQALMYAAGDAIMAVYTARSFGLVFKSDQSPVTDADLAAHRVIVDGLTRLTPDIPVVSEEDPASLAVPRHTSVYWLIDPLDGTKEFLQRNDQFTCNLALIEHHRATLGFVGVPAQGELYVGGQSLGSSCTSQGGLTRVIRHHRASEDLTRVVASKSHLNEATRQYIDCISGDVELVQAGSSLKFLKIAVGEADIYPRLGPTCEWDTAAAQAVLEGAGGRVIQLSGKPLEYGKEEILNPHFVATAI